MRGQTVACTDGDKPPAVRTPGESLSVAYGARAAAERGECENQPPLISSRHQGDGVISADVAAPAGRVTVDAMAPPRLDEAGTASALAIAAGDLARRAFGSHLATTVKSSPLDLVTDIDHSAEALIVGGLQVAFPHHTVISEESGGNLGSERWTWLVDPLDGTANFVMGLPLYGLSIVLLDRLEPVLAVVRDSHLGRQLVVGPTGSVTTSGDLVITAPSHSASKAVALQQGYPVLRQDPSLSALRDGLERSFRRVLYTWSPSIDLLLLAAGRISGIVGYRCAGPEHVAARFAAARLGLAVEIVEGDSRSPLSPVTYVVGAAELMPHLCELATG